MFYGIILYHCAERNEWEDSIEMWLIRFFVSEICNLDPEIVSSLLFFFFLIWLHWVLVGTCRIFTAACWIFSCSLWDPASWPGIEPGPLHWECRVLATGSPGKSLLYFLEWNNVTLGSGAAYPCAARLVEAGLQRKAEGNEADFAKKRRNQGP